MSRRREEEVKEVAQRERGGGNGCRRDDQKGETCPACGPPEVAGRREVEQLRSWDGDASGLPGGEDAWASYSCRCKCGSHHDGEGSEVSNLGKFREAPRGIPKLELEP